MAHLTGNPVDKPLSVQIQMYEKSYNGYPIYQTAGVTIKYQSQTYVMPYNGKISNTNCGPHT